jgi:hypothetical protein
VKSVLIIGFVWPEPIVSCGWQNDVQLISLFQKQGFITFASPAQDSDFMVDLSLYKVKKKQSITLNSSSFDVFVKQLQPSILFDRFMIEEQFGWRVAENCPNAVRILDTEDLHCLRLARQKAYKEKREFKTVDLLREVAKEIAVFCAVICH